MLRAMIEPTRYVGPIFKSIIKAPLQKSSSAN